MTEHATIGHNITADLRTTLELKHEPITARAAELLAAEARLPTIDNDDAAGKVTDYIKQVTAAIKNSEGLRTAEKEPYLEGSRVVDGFFIKGISDPLTALKGRVSVKLTNYLREKEAKERRERERLAELARQDEDRKRREAAAAAAKIESEKHLDEAIKAEDDAQQATVDRIAATDAAQVKPAELSRTRGDYGALSSLRASWQYEVADINAVPRQFLMLNDAAIKAHMKARVKDKPPAPIDGIRFYEDTAAVVR